MNFLGAKKEIEDRECKMRTIRNGKDNENMQII